MVLGLRVVLLDDYLVILYLFGVGVAALIIVLLAIPIAEILPIFLLERASCIVLVISVALEYLIHGRSLLGLLLAGRLLHLAVS